MRKLIITALCVLISFCGLTQKEKPRFAGFNANNSLVVAYKTGVVAIYNVPDLTLEIELTPDDRKNNTREAFLSPKGDRLVVYDSKLKGQIIWDVINGKKINSVETDRNSNTVFFPENRVLFTGKEEIIYDLETGKTVDNLDGLNLDHPGIKVSPSGDLLLNYNNLGGEVVIYDLKNSKKILEKDLSSVSIDDATYFISDDTIKLVFTPIGESPVYYKIPTRGEFYFEDLENYVYNDSPYDVPGLDYHGPSNSLIYEDEILLPINDDRSFINSISSVSAISPDDRWIAVVNKDNVIKLYDLSEKTSVEVFNKKYEQAKSTTVPIGE